MKKKKRGGGERTKKTLIIEQKIPINRRLWRLLPTPEYPLESLLVDVLGRAGINIPHAERNRSLALYDDLVATP